MQFGGKSSRFDTTHQRTSQGLKAQGQGLVNWSSRIVEENRSVVPTICNFQPMSQKRFDIEL